MHGVRICQMDVLDTGLGPRAPDPTTRLEAACLNLVTPVILLRRITMVAH